MRQASPPVDLQVNVETGGPAVVTTYNALTNACFPDARRQRRRAPALWFAPFKPFAFPFPLCGSPSPLSICAF